MARHKELPLKGDKLVRFSNDANTAVINQLSTEELSLYYYLLYCLFEKGYEEVIIDFNEIKDITGLNDYSPKNLYNWLFRFWDKAKVTSIMEEERNAKGKPVAFFAAPFYGKFKADYEKEELLLTVNPHAYNYVNGLTSNYTTAKLNNVIAAGSTYSARLHSLLSQYKFTRWWKVDVEQFKFMMDCPKSYSTSKFNERCLAPAIEEQKEFFPNLEVIYKLKGNRISQYQFTFDKITKKSKEEIQAEKELLSKSKSRSKKANKTSDGESFDNKNFSSPEEELAYYKEKLKDNM